jgi:hypothetical protein
MTILSTDTFTGADGTLLTARGPDTGGGAWLPAIVKNQATTAPKILGNRLTGSIGGASTQAVYYLSAAPGSADYSASVDWQISATSGGDGFGPGVRVTPGAAGSGYWFLNFQALSRVAIYCYNNGTPYSFIGPQPPTTGTTFDTASTYRSTIKVVGAVITCQIQALTGTNAGKYLDSTPAWVTGAVDCITYTDPSPLTVTGFPSIYLGQSAVAPSAGAVYMDNFSVDGVPAAATAVTASGASAGNVGVPSPFTVGANGPIAGTVNVTLSSSNAGATFAPASVALTAANPTAIIQFTPAVTGVDSIFVANDAALTNPAALSFTTSPAPIPTPERGFKIGIGRDKKLIVIF